jgi:two-component system, sensor histidine kinase
LVAPKEPSLLRDLAHEVRDALSPVRSAVDLMRLRGFAPEVVSAVAGRIEQGLDRALATLDAFLLAEQCESGTAVLTVAPVSLTRLLERVHEAVPAPLRSRCRFEPPSPDIAVLADAERSAQALAAMVLHVLAVARGSPLEVRVASAGVPQLLLAFACAEPPVSEDWFGTWRSPPGAAPMALRTARELVRLQQGNVELRAPAPGRAELVVEFPRASATAPGVGSVAGVAAARSAERRGEVTTATASQPSRGPNGAGGARLLMVEDNAEVRRAYREALLVLGYEVGEARSAEEALAAVTESPPEIVLIDINLPGMNGYRLAKALKAKVTGPIRLVMLSGVTLDDMTLQLSRQAGFDQCFDKAAGPKALHALLMRLQGGPGLAGQ